MGHWQDVDVFFYIVDADESFNTSVGYPDERGYTIRSVFTAKRHLSFWPDGSVYKRINARDAGAPPQKVSGGIRAWIRWLDGIEE